MSPGPTKDVDIPRTEVPGIARLLTLIATLGFIGYLPAAPGTFGTLASAMLFVVVRPGSAATFLLLLVSILFGTVSAHYAEKHLKEKDSRKIVIDEFAGYAASVLLLPPTLFFYGAAFLLFRFFDILKPPPIRSIERAFPGGLGIVADDLMAGIYTNIALQLWNFLIMN